VGKVKAAAQNSGKIKIGQELRYVLANFPDREFGTLTGRVKNISLLPDAEGKLVDILLPENLKPITIKQPFSARNDRLSRDHHRRFTFTKRILKPV
jgi:hypothetical protein